MKIKNHATKPFNQENNHKWAYEKYSENGKKSRPETQQDKNKTYSDYLFIYVQADDTSWLNKVF